VHGAEWREDSGEMRQVGEKDIFITADRDQIWISVKADCNAKFGPSEQE
jgi:hypothetical protein